MRSESVTLTLVCPLGLWALTTFWAKPETQEAANKRKERILEVLIMDICYVRIYLLSCQHLYLDQGTLGQILNCYSATSGIRLSKELGIHLVHGSKISDITQITVVLVRMNW